jgi:hypothetical protein
MNTRCQKDGVTRDTKPAFEFADPKIKKRWAMLEEKRFAEFIGIAVTTPAAVSTTSTLEQAALRLSTWQRYVLYAGIAVALASGVVAGYYTTYDEAVDHDNESFRKALLDPAMWRATAKLLREGHISKEMTHLQSQLKRIVPDIDTSDFDKLRMEAEPRCCEMRHWLSAHL